MPAFIVSCDLIFRKTFSMVQSRKIRFLAGRMWSMEGMNERLKAAAAKLLLTEDCFYLYDEAGIQSRARALTRSFLRRKSCIL